MIYHNIAQYNTDKTVWYSILEWLYDHTAVVGRLIEKRLGNKGTSPNSFAGPTEERAVGQILAQRQVTNII